MVRESKMLENSHQRTCGAQAGTCGEHASKNKTNNWHLRNWRQWIGKNEKRELVQSEYNVARLLAQSKLNDSLCASILSRKFWARWTRSSFLRRSAIAFIKRKNQFISVTVTVEKFAIRKASKIGEKWKRQTSEWRWTQNHQTAAACEIDSVTNTNSKNSQITVGDSVTVYTDILVIKNPVQSGTELRRS